MRKEGRPIFEQVIGFGFTELTILLLNNANLEVEGQENLSEVRQHLRKGSLMVYFNHSSLADPGIIIRLLKENIQDDYSEIAFFASQKHLDPERSFLTRIVMEEGARREGIVAIPVVQRYDRESYTEKEVQINLRAIREGLKILKSPGGVLVVSPEGTRSPEGKLIEGQEGAWLLLKRAEKALALPVGIIGARKLVGRWGYLPAPWVKVNLRLGEPLTAKKTMEEADKKNVEAQDLLMFKLASLLPVEMRGVYA